MDQRLQFLSSYQKEEMSVADLCREYGISRPTGYRWINRYNETGPEGLVDRSRRPHGCSHATLEPVENAIFALRAKHPSWGARKLKARLEMLQPDMVWPATSTFGNILSRAGLTSPQRKRKRTTPCSEPFSMVTGPNQLWCMDFKGYFATGDDFADEDSVLVPGNVAAIVFRFEELGVELITPGLYRVFFRDMEIGELNPEELRFRAARRLL
nr:helix-turn-helix domain-containing protein [Edaphobacter lichenicola]